MVYIRYGNVMCFLTCKGDMRLFNIASTHNILSKEQSCNSSNNLLQQLTLAQSTEPLSQVKLTQVTQSTSPQW